MFVMTAKISKPKLIAAGVAVVAIILLIILLASAGGGSSEASLNATPAGETNDERVAFLATYGWSVNADPTESQKVKIPETSDNKVFVRYNDLQQSQGFDLTNFSGKEVMRYVYEILNYPDATAPVYASVLVYDGHIIGGDITNSAPEGAIHGFELPPSSGNSTTVEPTQPSDVSTATEMTEATESSEPVENSNVSAPTEPSES